MKVQFPLVIDLFFSFPYENLQIFQFHRHFILYILYFGKYLLNMQLRKSSILSKI